MGAKGLLAWGVAGTLLTSATYAALLPGGFLEPLGGRLDRILQEDPRLPSWPEVTLPPLHLGESRLRFDAEASAALPLQFQWVYQQTRYRLDAQVDEDAYDAFRERPRILDPRLYSLYVTEADDDEFIAELASHLEQTARDQGFTRLERANFLLAFVQGLEYVSDEVGLGADDHPKYPLETLVEDGGDCEDTSILYVSLLQALDEDALLLLLPGHMATGIRLPGESAYRYAETSAAGLRVGEIPPSMESKETTPIPLEPRPALTYRWWASPTPTGDLKFVVRVDNQGDAPSGTLQVNATATPPGEPARQATGTLSSIGPGATQWIEIRLRIPGAGPAEDPDVTLFDPESASRIRPATEFHLAPDPLPF